MQGLYRQIVADALLDRAAFCLLWHGGLRLGEVEELELNDLDILPSLSACFPNRRLMVRKGKGLRDRAVYLNATAVDAVRAYLNVLGLGPTNHLFLYRNEPVNKDPSAALRAGLIRYRLKAVGRRVGVNAYPHRLRHSCATQLVNAGCPVTSIQKFLGHKRLNSTMNYARVQNRTVAEDYYAAMEVVEKRLKVVPPETEDKAHPPASDDERTHLLELATQLAEPELGVQMRLALVDRMCGVLNHRTPLEKQPWQNESGIRPWALP